MRNILSSASRALSRAGPSTRAAAAPAPLARSYAAPCHSSSTSDTTHKSSTQHAGSASEGDTSERKSGGQGRAKGRKSPYTTLVSRRACSTGSSGTGKGSALGGRRGRSTSQHRTSDTDYTASDTLRDPYAFRPLELQRSAFNLHNSLNPPHMPLPVHLGTNHYTQINPRHPVKPFQPMNLPSLISPNIQMMANMGKKGRYTGMEDHLNILTALSHPDLVDFLGGAAAPIDFFKSHSQARGSSHASIDNDGLAARIIGDASSRTIDHADAAWEVVLQRMDTGLAGTHGKEEFAKVAAGKAQAAVDLEVAVSEVNKMLSAFALKDKVVSPFTLRARENRRRAALGRSATSGSSSEEVKWIALSDGFELTSGVSEMSEDLAERVASLVAEGLSNGRVSMDSVQRKRKKKISKHKYQKRRKANRAERKRLGK